MSEGAQSLLSLSTVVSMQTRASNIQTRFYSYIVVMQGNKKYRNGECIEPEGLDGCEEVHSSRMRSFYVVNALYREAPHRLGVVRLELCICINAACPQYMYKMHTHTHIR